MELNLKPSHAKVRDYYNALNQYGQLNISHETAVREAFGLLLDICAIDQYQISTDKRSGIANDPNRDDDREYILRLIGQGIAVSLETVKISSALLDLGLPTERTASAATLQ